MAQRYPIPGQTHRAQEEIRRSRFITTVGYTPTVEEARAFIAQVKAEFDDASHNCGPMWWGRRAARPRPA